METLKIIGTIEVGEKLYIRDAKLFIDKNPDNFRIILKRWLYSDNRKNTLEFIENSVNVVAESAHHEKEPWEHVNSLACACDGLKKLKVTYKNDDTTVASIVGLCDKIQFKIKSIRQINEDNRRIFTPVTIPNVTIMQSRPRYTHSM